MVTTVKLLSTYPNPAGGSFSPNTIVDLPDSVAAYLLQDNIGATTVLGGGKMGALATSIQRLTAPPVFGEVPPEFSRTAMYLGDSISEAAVGAANLPRNRPVRYISPTFPNLNVNGSFMSRLMASPNAPTANGTLRYYAADSTLTWQANGDTEGPRVTVSMENCFYRVESGTGGRELYISAIPRMKPNADASDSISLVGNVKLRNNCASHGIVGWTNALLGNPFDVVYMFAISSIRASDWWAARSQWQDIYTDVTHIFLGTNDVTDLATSQQALRDLESIIRTRQAIGSKVVVGSLLPYNARTTAATRAAVEFNLALRTLGAKMGVPVWDAWRFVGLSTGTGSYATGMSGDGLHPGGKGGYAIAKRGIIPNMQPLIRRTLSRPFAGATYDAATAPYGNLLSIAQLTGNVAVASAGCTGESPTGWTVVRDSGSVITAVSKAPASAGAVPLPDGVQGNFWTVTISNTGGVDGETIRLRPTAFLTAGVTPGDYVVFEGAIRVSGAGIQTFAVSMFTQGGAAATVVAIEENRGATTAIDNLDGDTVFIPFRTEAILLDAGNTGLNFGFTVTLNANGSAVFEVSPVGLSVHRVPAPV